MLVFHLMLVVGVFLLSAFVCDWISSHPTAPQSVRRPLNGPRRPKTLSRMGGVQYRD